MKAPAVFVLILAAVLLAAILVSIGIGDVWISPADVFQILVFGGPADSAEVDIVWIVRMPRILLAAAIGGGLAVAGAGYQGLFRNPLADPFLLGASSGAALGATVAIVCHWDDGVLGMAPVHLSALAGAVLAVSAVYLIAVILGHMPTTSLLLAGVAVSTFIGAIVSVLMILNEKDTLEILQWLMGRVSDRGWSMVGWTLPIVLVGFCVLWLSSRGLDVLTFGEESASALGLRLNLLRALVVLAAGMVTAGGVAAGGIIGFVGLIAPHMARSIVGAKHRWLFPASCLLGALLLLIADDLARTVAAPRQLPVGVFTALVGGPFFLYLLHSRQRDLARPS